jgi:hypothetical protein
MGILETVLSQLPQADAAKPAGKEGKQDANNPTAAKPKAKVDEKPGSEEKPAGEKTDELELAAEEQPEEEPAPRGAKKTGLDYSPEFKEKFGERA